MTKRHFIELAERLKNLRPQHPEDMDYDDARDFGLEFNLWRRMVREMANFCACHNERFDRGKFYAACGYEEEESGRR